MAWIRVETGLRDHPKVRKVAKDCGIDQTTALGMIVRLWLWTADHAADGNLGSFGPDDIEAAAGWTGAENKLFESLLRNHLIDSDADGSICLHDWTDYAGSWQHATYARQRREAKRQG